MLMDMDFLDLQIDEMDAIEKVYHQYDFPAVSFHQTERNYTAFFNKQAAKILEGYVCAKIYANAEYVVFVFSDKKDCHSYKIHRNNMGGHYICCSKLKRLILEGKTFKLYNTQKGFAIKINEPIKKRK